MKRLVADLNGTVFTANDASPNPVMADFEAIRADAKAIAISPSTFAWWAVYLGGAKRIHFPIMPAPTLLPWCKLVVAGDARYRYDDWWRGEAVDLDHELHLGKRSENHDQTEATGLGGAGAGAGADADGGAGSPGGRGGLGAGLAHGERSEMGPSARSVLQSGPVGEGTTTSVTLTGSEALAAAGSSIQERATRRCMQRAVDKEALLEGLRERYLHR